MTSEMMGRHAAAHVTAALHANGFAPLHPWARSTGLRTAALRYEALPDPALARVAEDFLVNSRYSRANEEWEVSVRDYFQDEASVMLSMSRARDHSGLSRIALPEGARLNLSLAEALKRRRSVREFSGDPIRLPQLATLLRSAAGETAIADADLTDGGQCSFHFRTAPSGGGLFPVETHVIALDVAGLERGVYLYSSAGDHLVHLGDHDVVARALDAFYAPEGTIALHAASCLVVLTARPWRSMRKYGPRGMRFVFMECGYICQNVHLATAALGLGSTDFSAFFDEELDAALGFDGVFETVVHTLVVGS